MPIQFQDQDRYEPLALVPQESPQQLSNTEQSFYHHYIGCETTEDVESPASDNESIESMDWSPQHEPLTATCQPTNHETSTPIPHHASAEVLRYQVTLNAPTAMMKQTDDIPVTYLNKSQVYVISIADTTPPMPLSLGSQYRTSIRISFVNEQQRQRRAACWQMWKEGRGADEARQRGGRMHAVEYIETGQHVESDAKRARVNLDAASLDGFTVIWTPRANYPIECSIAVRFNFLSTDFSHLHGVKGIPVWLCSKTETIATGSLRSGTKSSETVFCKICLFRDYGAERKRLNDTARASKAISKLAQLIRQDKTTMNNVKQWQRTGLASIQSPTSRSPGKALKRKRSLSVPSSTKERVHIDGTRQLELQAMHDLLTSSRPATVLNLCGPEEDDPDLYPVALPGEPINVTQVGSKVSALSRQIGSHGSPTTGAIPPISSHSSSISLLAYDFETPTVNELQSSAQLCRLREEGNLPSNPQQLASPPDLIPKLDVLEQLGDYNEGHKGDSSYKTPVELATKPAACFYILYRNPGEVEEHRYYRAVYLMQRTLKEFTTRVASKWNIEPRNIIRALLVLERGVEVEMDDDYIRGLAEGQDLIMEVVETQDSTQPDDESELEALVKDSVDCDGMGCTQGGTRTGRYYELRLTFEHL